MKIKVVLAIIIALNVVNVCGQRASDVLEHGISIRQNQKLFLRYESGVLKYDIAENRPDNFLTLPDSVIFLAKNIGVNIYIKPLNPLNYSFTNDLTVIPDPIEAQASAYIDRITAMLNKIDDSFKIQKSQKAISECSSKYQKLRKCYDSIKQRIDQENEKIGKNFLPSFKALKSLTFCDAKTTGDSLLLVIYPKIKMIKDRNDTIDTLIKRLDKNVSKYLCDQYPDALVVQHIFKEIISQLTIEFSKQKKQVDNLQKSYDLVFKTYKQASYSNDGHEWCLLLKEVAVQRGKIARFTVTINQSGYALSDSGEIVENKTVEKVKRTINFRKFNFIVPEISAGVAYATLSFPKYSTEPDSSGALHVAEAGNENFKRLSIDAMLNLVGYIPNSMIHPFFQVGIGANANYPTLLTGVGLRLNFVPLKRLALSFGFASTWIQQLDKLKPGDVVKSEAELSQDLKYQFNWPPKPYFGIQYNF